MRRLYAPRHLTAVARRLQLLKACGAEVARLRELEEDNAEATAVLPIEDMREMVFGTQEQEAA